MTSHKRRVGTIGPKKFVQKLKQENMMFQGLTQQDAHEFLNYTINEISDLLRRDDERAAKLSQVCGGRGGRGGGHSKRRFSLPVHLAVT